MMSTLAQKAITLKEAFPVWVRVAVYSFGGPAGQMAVMHSILVEEKKWISERRFLHALNYTMLLPGPEAQQLATYIGWLLHGTRGGLIAGILFILPGFFSILLLSYLYAGFQDLALVQAFFFGLKPAVMAIVIEAVFRIGSRAITNRIMLAIAAIAFFAILFLEIPFPWIVFSAALLGYLLGRFRPQLFDHSEDAEPFSTRDAILQETSVSPSLKRSLLLIALFVVLWFGPIALIAARFGADNIFVTIGLFFSKTAVVTFGGAYAVLAYIAQQAVEVFGWLQPGQMLDGLGMAETTPGPLIQVVQFVGFMGAYTNAGALSPLVAGLFASLLTTWVTFVPCFLWIFLGAPYVESLRGNRSLAAALEAITAAVVGVVLNLALWFSVQTLFSRVDEAHWGPIRLLIPDFATLDWASLLIAAAAFIALFRYKMSLIKVLALSAAAGFVYYMLFLV